MKVIALASLLISSPLLAQDRYTLWDSITVTLTNQQTDTVWVDFPVSQTPHPTRVAITNSANPTLPPIWTRQSGNYQAWFDTTKVSGAAADSFRVSYAPRDPTDGKMSANDRTYIVGTASTFGDLKDDYSFPISLYATNGMAFVLQKGDLNASVVKVVLKLYYTQ